MFRKIKRTPTLLHVNNSVEGEPLCRKIERMISNKEPIESVSPIIYTPKKDGVIAAYNIRTDRWKIAQKAMDAANKSWIAKRQASMEKTNGNGNGNGNENGNGNGNGNENGTEAA